MRDENKWPRLSGRVNLRIGEKLQVDIREAVKKDPDRYDNESHFVRVAIMKLLRETEHNDRR